LVFNSSGSEEVKAALQEANGVLMRARAGTEFPPASAEDKAIYKYLFKFKRAGFPTNVIIPADPALRPILLPEFLTQKTVLHALSLAAGEDQKLAAN